MQYMTSGLGHSMKENAYNIMYIAHKARDWSITIL